MVILFARTRVSVAAGRIDAFIPLGFNCDLHEVPSMTFSTLGLSEPLLKAVLEQGYNTPTPIQAQAIPPILKGHDILALHYLFCSDWRPNLEQKTTMLKL